jgi:hypothetical protein
MQTMLTRFLPLLLLHAAVMLAFCNTADADADSLNLARTSPFIRIHEPSLARNATRQTMLMRFLPLLLLAFCDLANVDSLNLARVGALPYELGDNVVIECYEPPSARAPSGAWVPGFVCVDDSTGDTTPLSVRFGIDSFVECAVPLSSVSSLDRLAAVAEQRDDWHCRVAVTPDARAHVPLTINVWGLVDDGPAGLTVHVNAHINFLFHIDADAGAVLGAAGT